jgi:hypothetical protein
MLPQYFTNAMLGWLTAVAFPVGMMRLPPFRLLPRVYHEGVKGQSGDHNLGGFNACSPQLVTASTMHH